mmetsp:Transcript_6262/g.9096  ORF Transcript_6262/g.9096 Transcript_6262/m.9096 type:complete len:350 (+) Transcript_6262:105-1154(+)|eukprot:CAMPEP_0184855358 /NCGR_PEP_ID=MMETSP0580-20130426/636_1 /TAXON_ID=1118495 /ORGANISM="Dactyliosolen fragilissimus" /LENGTH=349 /DNA_ID=CAMNT_0027349855 /DNA_START=77 /DNA_END=1126 /DNA_ORIENTATION=+
MFAKISTSIFYYYPCQTSNALLLCLIFVNILLMSRAEENEGEDGELNDSEITRNLNDGDASSARGEEWLLVAFLSLSFAFMLSLIGTFIGYYNVKEGNMMRKYLEEGKLVHASVLHVDMQRCHQSMDGQELSSELTVCVQYVATIRDNYKVKIRKQLNAQRRDFTQNMTPQHITVKQNMKTIPISPLRLCRKSNTGIPEDGNTVDDHFSVTEWQQMNDNEGISFDGIDLYVLPNHPTSGFPKKQVDKRCTVKYHAPIILLISCLFILSEICIFYCAKYVMKLDYSNNLLLGASLLSIMIIVFIFDIPAIHFLFSGCLDSSLNEDYVSDGEFMPIEIDESTISTESDSLC